MKGFLLISTCYADSAAALTVHEHQDPKRLRLRVTKSSSAVPDRFYNSHAGGGQETLVAIVTCPPLFPWLQKARGNNGDGGERLTGSTKGEGGGGGANRGSEAFEF